MTLAGAVVLATSGSLAFAAYTGDNEKSTETQVVKTQSEQVTREVHSDPVQVTSQTNMSFQGYTYEQQGEIMRQRKAERDQRLMESEIH